MVVGFGFSKRQEIQLLASLEPIKVSNYGHILFENVGHGVCQDHKGEFSAWGWKSGSEHLIRKICADFSDCHAFWHHSGNNWQMFCASQTDFCPNAGNGAVHVTQASGKG